MVGDNYNCLEIMDCGSRLSGDPFHILEFNPSDDQIVLGELTVARWSVEMILVMWDKDLLFLHARPWKPGWQEIDIHGCYSLVKIAFAPICTYKNNRQIWRHNASISRSRDVTDQLWWLHNTKSEKTILGDDCEMSNRWLFLEKLCVKDMK